MENKPPGLTQYNCPQCGKRYFLAFVTDKEIQCRACRVALLPHEAAKDAAAGTK